MKVDDFAERNEVVATMPTPELRAYIDEVQQRGADTANLELTLHSRTANAAAILVLTLIGVSIAARRIARRDGPALVCRRAHWVHLRLRLEGDFGVGCVRGLAALVSADESGLRLWLRGFPTRCSLPWDGGSTSRRPSDVP